MSVARPAQSVVHMILVYIELRSMSNPLSRCVCRLLPSRKPTIPRCHVTFGQKPMTRKERANKVNKSDYFSQYGEEARRVLEVLLDKYADTGILELENIAILLTPQLAQFGKPQKIMKYFGGMEGYMSAVKNMESRLL